VKDFNGVLERVKPTLVLAPSLQDTHPDHRGTGLLVWRTMTARGEQDRVRYWIVHGGREWPAPPGYHPSFAQTVAIRGGSVEEIAAELHGELEGFAGLCVVGTGPAGETPHAVAEFRDVPAGAAE